MSEPSRNGEDSHEVRHNARIGLWLFALYTLFYAGFIVLSAFERQKMAQLYFGVTLSVLYGFFLILSAFVLALVYLRVSKDADEEGGR
jgi:uncharacterized membrane protein (DUF485 family)